MARTTPTEHQVEQVFTLIMGGTQRPKDIVETMGVHRRLVSDACKQLVEHGRVRSEGTSFQRRYVAVEQADPVEPEPVLEAGQDSDEAQAARLVELEEQRGELASVQARLCVLVGAESSEELLENVAHLALVNSSGAEERERLRRSELDLATKIDAARARVRKLEVELHQRDERMTRLEELLDELEQQRNDQRDQLDRLSQLFAVPVSGLEDAAVKLSATAPGVLEERIAELVAELDQAAEQRDQLNRALGERDGLILRQERLLERYREQVKTIARGLLDRSASLAHLAVVVSAHPEGVA